MKKKVLLWLNEYKSPFDIETNELLFYRFPSISKGNILIIWVKNYEEFVSWIINNDLPHAICFDYLFNKTGYNGAKWLIEYCTEFNKKLPVCSVLSDSPLEKNNIQSVLDNFNSNNTYKIKMKIKTLTSTQLNIIRYIILGIGIITIITALITL